MRTKLWLVDTTDEGLFDAFIARIEKDGHRDIGMMGFEGYPHVVITATCTYGTRSYRFDDHLPNDRLVSD